MVSGVAEDLLSDIHLDEGTGRVAGECPIVAGDDGGWVPGAEKDLQAQEVAGPTDAELVGMGLDVAGQDFAVPVGAGKPLEGKNLPVVAADLDVVHGQHLIGAADRLAVFGGGSDSRRFGSASLLFGSLGHGMLISSRPVALRCSAAAFRWLVGVQC
jgi:hypothetical protein